MSRYLVCNNVFKVIFQLKGGVIFFFHGTYIKLAMPCYFITKYNTKLDFFQAPNCSKHPILCHFFQVGTESEPYTKQAIITLHGHVRSPQIPIYGNKVLAVRNGVLSLYGIIRCLIQITLVKLITAFTYIL